MYISILTVKKINIPRNKGNTRNKGNINLDLKFFAPHPGFGQRGSDSSSESDGLCTDMIENYANGVSWL